MSNQCNQSLVLSLLGATVGAAGVIYNVDETCYCLTGKVGKVLMKKGTKSPQVIIGGLGRENVTVQTCISGNGRLLPPYVLYSGKRLMSNHTNDGPAGTKYAVAQNGFMTTEAFINWFRNLFIPELPCQRSSVLLILNGHTSHVSFELQSKTTSPSLSCLLI